MKKSHTELTYLRAAAQNANSVGLVIILYDLLLHDLELAIVAFKAGDIEGRTREIKHSFLVLQQLEGSLDKENGAEAATNLAGFYSLLRSKVLEAHIKASPEILRQQIELVIEVRQAWQQVDKPNLGPGYRTVELASDQGTEFAMASPDGEAASNRWTA